jgi:uncharacterized protein (DUF302 family)
MSYYFAKIVQTNFEETLIKVEEELKKESFGVLTEIDVQATFKKKLDVDFRKYKILGACNPPFAHKALTAEDKVGVLLPCNVIVQELENNNVEVAIVNPIDSMQSVKNDKLGEIASEVTDKLKRVLDKI